MTTSYRGILLYYNVIVIIIIMLIYILKGRSRYI